MKLLIPALITLMVILLVFPACAHVPGVTGGDVTVVPDAEKSYAWYGSLEDADEADQYIITTEAGTEIRLSVSTPDTGVRPSAALIGPGITAQDPLPGYMEVPEGQGSILIPPAAEPEVSYEPFQVLLGISVLGFIPSLMTYHVGSALIIYLTYLVPILPFADIRTLQPFIIANGFLLSVFCTSLVLRALTERTLDREIVLRAELARSERTYRDLFENAMEAIFVVDEHFRYVDANRKAEELSGYTREELLQRTILDMVPPDQVARSAAELEKLRSRGQYTRFEGRMRTNDGRIDRQGAQPGPQGKRTRSRFNRSSPWQGTKPIGLSRPPTGP